MKRNRFINQRGRTCGWFYKMFYSVDSCIHTGIYILLWRRWRRNLDDLVTFFSGFLGTFSLACLLVSYCHTHTVSSISDSRHWRTVTWHFVVDLEEHDETWLVNVTARLLVTSWLLVMVKGRSPGPKSVETEVSASDCTLWLRCQATPDALWIPNLIYWCLELGWKNQVVVQYFATRPLFS